MRLASRHLRVPLPALLLLLAACPGPDANATLADLPGLRVAVQTWDASDTEPTAGFVVVSYDADAYMAAHGGQCATLGGDLGGALESTALAPSSYGSSDDEFGGCYFAHLPFDIQFADGRASVLTINDDSLTIRAEFPNGAFAPHHPTLRVPATWQFRGGQEVQLDWSHPADLAVGLEETDVGFHIGDRGTPNAAGDNFFPLPPQVAGAELRFTIPSPPPITGPGVITFFLGYSVGDATTCTGATTCAYSASRGFNHSVEIAR